MSNKLALILFAIVLAGVGLDLALNDGRSLLFLGRKFFELLNWMAFWR